MIQAKRSEFLLILFLLLCCGHDRLLSQNDTTPIPHKTLKDKCMWPHRKITRMIIKDRPVFFDTTYIKTYKKYLVVTIPVSTRLLNFTLHDNISNKTINFAPNNQYDVGISINSRWASFLINTGITFFSKDNAIKGQTSYKDYQFNLYLKRFTTDINLQYYKGFYVSNTKSLIPPGVTLNGPYELKHDLNALAVGVSTSYIFNYKKFSYRNSFAFTEQQLKSVGSFLAGGYYSLLTTGSDSCMIPYTLRSNFDTTAYIKSSVSQKAGINLGYIYTLVIRKKGYITLSLINGLGYTKLSTTNINNVKKDYSYQLADQLSVRVATGFDNGTFFTGLMGIFDNYDYSSRSKESFDFSIGKFRVFIGYRLNMVSRERKLLKKLGLIDWNNPPQRAK